MSNEMASPLTGKTAPRLFISYSHDSREHEDRVRALADHLRQDGIDALIDQYDPTPPEGWPMWMDREIQKADFIALICSETYLRRVEGRELPGKGRGVLWEAKLVYNLLYGEDSSYQRFIPILLNGGVPSSIPLPIRGLTHYQVDTDQGYEEFYRHLTSQPQHEKPKIGKLKALPSMPPQSYPASLEIRTEQRPSTSLDLRNRLQMIKRVRMDWIDGVLKQSLYNVARIELGLLTRSNAVEQPLRALVQTPDQPSMVIPAGTAMSQIFDDYGSALLILGAPGAGKTTFLLELANDLLDRAEQNVDHPIPVVFNLSSWAVRRQSLHQWLVSELNVRSDVPKTLAQRWLETEQVIPLLDGLDEVGPEYRQACVEAINNFRRDHGLLPIAICSRIADYEALGLKLRLRNALLVQPLTKPEIQAYLDRTGEPLQPLQESLVNDPSLWELLETPLMLWVAMLAYRDVPLEFSAADNLEQRRARLFANFVDAMFKRRSIEARYSPKQTISWLRWLASALIRRQQTVFYLENLSEKWLSTRLQKAISVTAFIASIGLVSALLFSAVFAPAILSGESRDEDTSFLILLPSIAAVGATIGLVFGLVGALMDSHPVETINLNLNSLSFRLGRSIRNGLIGGLGFGLIVTGLYLVMIFSAPIVGGHIRGEDLIGSSVFGLEAGLTAGLVFGIYSLFSAESVKTRRNPNQGTFRSLKMALATGLVIGLLAVGVLKLFNQLTDNDWSSWLVASVVSLLFGFTSGLIGGGLFSIRHFALRLMLWIKRFAPLRYVRFLDYAVERLFLRNVGGGYIFLHRMLLEYFASLPED